ncbi:MAG: hypothetical protein IPJ19_06120 [Planctomycetes bacterium]|nr:hypothetical protein [Planctomycetota bacterium]
MNPSQPRDRSRATLLLLGGALALGVPLVWQRVAMQTPSPPLPAAAPEGVRPAGTGAEQPELTRALAERSALPRAEGSVIELDDEDLAPPERASGAKKEREYYAEFLALETDTPGALDLRARDVLASAGSAAEKVALLRAASQKETPHAADWLELTLRTSEDRRARGGSLASFALELLGRRALTHEHDRDALESLCLSNPIEDLALRRRTTAKFAAAADDAGLARLAGALLREQDDLVIASALSSLQGREKTGEVQRILEQWPERAAKAAVHEPTEAP